MANASAPRLPPPPPPTGRVRGAVAAALARDAFGREIADPTAPAQPEGIPGGDAQPAKKKESATDALGRRAGALTDELDFPKFVASLIHGTFDAMVDSAIRQMQAYADLVAAVAKPLEQFTQENVSLNQARDYLVEQHPRDVMLVDSGDGLTLAPVVKGTDGEPPSPRWLADYGLAGEELTTETLEEKVLPAAREHAAKSRLQTLATMVLMGINRIVVKDGTIGARLRFRAAAADHAAVQYASGGDPEGSGEQWGARSSASDPLPSTKVSTVGVNVQSDSELKAELFGEVKINFVSETVPLDRFVDDAKRALLERDARAMPSAPSVVKLVPPAGPGAAAPAAASPSPAPIAPATPPAAGAPA
ncbi:MAG: hypothetical protein ABI624_02005 [Casimicrobiaceae bacterium]